MKLEWQSRTRWQRLVEFLRPALRRRRVSLARLELRRTCERWESRQS